MPSESPHHEISIFVNNKPLKTREHELTGAAIKALAGVPTDYELYHVRGSETVAIGNDQVVHLHEDEHFRAIPPGTFGANGSAS